MGTETIGRLEAWTVGLFAERVELRDREVWAQDLDESEMNLKGVLADGLSEEEFWRECTEGLCK